jgi:hypothetical protein
MTKCKQLYWQRRRRIWQQRLTIRKVCETFFFVGGRLQVRVSSCNSNKSPTTCNNSPVYFLTFIYSSTYFGHFPAHHQELNDCSGSLWFYLRIMVTVMLCSWLGRLWGIGVCNTLRFPITGQTTNKVRLSPRYKGKTRDCHCSRWDPDDGRENARNMLSCKQTSG